MGFAVNVYLKALFGIADSKTGKLSYADIDSKYGNGTAASLHRSGYFDKITVDGADWLRIRLEGYALANDLRTNNNSRVFNILSFVLSIVSILVSVTAVIAGAT